ncbi:1,4-alpha-glucan branching enzyme [Candidatus Fermentibacteria bacterium]|nr:MAG: 1,4-alpha-glucan branching enzyme [Candidatus Fermentibacteria bacterium]
MRQDDINRVIDCSLADPHSILGMHRTEEGITVRTFCPAAEQAELIAESFSEPMKRIDKRGFFILNTAEKHFFPYRLRFTGKDGNIWQTRDPYSFPPQLGDLDLHLFSAGKHLELHRKMGGRLWEHDGTEGTLFTVWAPNAKAVSVTGTFNGWDRRRHPMRTLGASGVWELFIPGVSEGDIYRFVIRTADGTLLEKSDPYAAMCENRPRNASIVSDPFSFKWSDEEWMEKRREINHFTEPLSIYELHGPSWAMPQGSFPTWKNLEEWLIPYVKREGFTHIELLPVMEHPLDDSWGYQVTGFLSPTGRLGTPQDFCSFINTCHRSGIGVILDWPPAHFPCDGWALAQFDGTCLYEHQDPRKGYHPDWNTLIFNYGRNEVRNFLFASAFQWLDTYHADGIRVDAVASMLYLDYSRKEGEWIPNRHGGRENIEAISFLKELNHYVGTEYPGVMMIAEESTDWSGVTAPPESGGLGFHFKWNMGWMNDTLEYFRSDPVYRKHMTDKITFSAMYAWSENYILPLSHDEVVHGKGSLLAKMPGDRERNLRLLLCFQWFFPGKQLLFMGGERAQEREWNHRESLPEGSTAMKEFISSLNRFTGENLQFYSTDTNPEGFRWVDFSDNEASVISFLRLAENEPPMLCVFNMTPVERKNYRIGVPQEGNWKIVFSSDPGPEWSKHSCDIPVHSFAQSVSLNLNGLGCVVLTTC